MWIDSHCHLTHERMKALGTTQNVIEEAIRSDVSGMLTISCRIKGDFPEILKIAQEHDHVWCSVGTHPHDAADEAEQEVGALSIAELAASDPNIIAIGETGLDYYYENAPRELQKESFRKHLHACIETGLPVIIHARESDQDILTILKEEGQGTKLKGVMHSFSSGRKLAEGALELGFYISFSGILTFPKAEELRDIARDVPLDRLLVETDAPYLAPVPVRGKINQPSYVRHTGKALAIIHNISEKDLASNTYKNFFKLFSKAKPS